MDSFYQDTQTYLKRILPEVVLDHAAFELPLKLCDLTKCRATCCHDGVRLSQRDANLISDLVEKNAAIFQSYGLQTDDKLVEKTNSGYKTKSRKAGEDELAVDFPQHFPQTRCVFLDDNHQCMLQKLAMGEQKHPWYYKPHTCWMHPLLVENENDVKKITVVQKEDDPQKRDGYLGYGAYTHCGREETNGQAAKTVLQAELKALGEIANRDFLLELNAEQVDWYE